MFSWLRRSPRLIDREPRRGHGRPQREQGAGGAHARMASLTRSRRGPQAGIDKMNLIGGAAPKAFWQNEPRAKTATISVGRSRGRAQMLPTRSGRPIRDDLAERTQVKNSKDFSGPAARP